MKRALAVLPWLVAGLPWLFVIARGVPQGEDLRLEVARVAAYSYTWLDGQWPPFWAPDLYCGFGSPIFLFYGQICVAISSVFALLTGSFSVGFTLALASASACGVFAIQQAAAACAPHRSAATAGRIAAYTFALNPYVLGNALLRNAGAEHLALSIMPLAIYGFVLGERERARGTLWLACSCALVIATHNLSALVVVACVSSLALVTCLGQVGGAARLRQAGTALGLGLALAAYAWLPALALKSWVQSEQLLSNKFDFHRQFQPLGLLFANTSFASAGPLPLAAAGAAIASLRRGDTSRTALERTAEQRWLLALLLVFAVCLFLQTRWAEPVWEHLPLLPYFGFPWRFMGPLALVSALLSASAFVRWTGPLSRGSCALAELVVLAACVSCALPPLMRVRGFNATEQQQFENKLAPAALQRQPFSTTARDEYLPRGAGLRAIHAPASDAPIVSAGDGFRIAVRQNRPRLITLDVSAPAHGTLCLTRWAFPTWQLSVDARPQPQAACFAGALGVDVPAGRHRIAARLQPPILRQIGLAISALGLLAAWRLFRSSRASVAA